jgi:molybdenum cofactor cytidylyltransferase
MKINGIILSAGLSSRVDGFKPLLNYKGQSFVSSILQKLYLVCDNIGVVTGYKNRIIEDEVNKCILNSKFNQNKIKLIYNSEFEKGMFSSLQVGLKDMSDCDWLLYHFVDQPHLPARFYSDFINQIDDSYNWIQPEYDQNKGHPILLNKSLFSQLLDSRVNSLKEISLSQSINKKIWTCKYKQVVEDIDTQDDYQKLT